MTHETTLTAILRAHGDQPLTLRAFTEIQDGLVDLLAEQIAPLRQRIAALENEVRVGLARIEALEAGNDRQGD